MRAREASAFLLFDDNFEVCECTKWVGRVLVVVIDLFQKRAENGMFAHSTRNAFALAAPNCRFMNNDTYGCMVTRYGPFHQVLKNMGVAMEVACLAIE